MSTDSYFIAVSSQTPDLEVALAIVNAAGKGYPIQGFSNGIISTDFWIIPIGKGNMQEIKTQLHKIPAIQNVLIVPLSKPIREGEIAEVREMFSRFGWDAGKVSNDLLSLFLASRLEGESRYYLHKELNEKGDVSITINSLEKHINFSTDRMQPFGPGNRRELTINDLEIRSVTIESITEEDEEEPPPPI